MPTRPRTLATTGQPPEEDDVWTVLKVLGVSLVGVLVLYLAHWVDQRRTRDD